MHAETSCPGEYLLSKMDYIVEEANKINNANPNNFLTIKKPSYFIKNS